MIYLLTFAVNLFLIVCVDFFERKQSFNFVFTICNFINKVNLVKREKMDGWTLKK